MATVVGRIQRCQKCGKLGRHQPAEDRCVSCKEEAAVQTLLSLTTYDFIGWVARQRSAYIERGRNEVIADFGEQLAEDWAAEIEGGLNDAAVFAETDVRLARRAARTVGQRPTWEAVSQLMQEE